MRQRTPSRLPALLLISLLLASATKEALGLTCRHHEPAAPDHSPSHAEQVPSDHHTPCTCSDHCFGAATTALASAGAIRLPLAVAPGSGLIAPEPEVDLPGPAPHTLPLANAPPHAL